MAEIRAYVCDVGEVLISEERLYGRWADHLGVSRFDFFAALGAVIEAGGYHREVFEWFAPDLDIEAAMAADVALGAFDADDLYPDVRTTLERLTAEGYLVGIVGNQPRRAESVLRDLDLPADFIATSEGWGVEKPDPAFFERVVAECGVPPEQIAYVGDRVDNDVLPAMAAGMAGVWMRRGPWARIHGRRPEAATATATIDSLDELPL